MDQRLYEIRRARMCRLCLRTRDLLEIYTLNETRSQFIDDCSRGNLRSYYLPAFICRTCDHIVMQWSNIRNHWRHTVDAAILRFVEEGIWDANPFQLQDGQVNEGPMPRVPEDPYNDAVRRHNVPLRANASSSDSDSEESGVSMELQERNADFDGHLPLLADVVAAAEADAVALAAAYAHVLPEEDDYYFDDDAARDEAARTNFRTNVMMCGMVGLIALCCIVSYIKRR